MIYSFETTVTTPSQYVYMSSTGAVVYSISNS